MKHSLLSICERNTIFILLEEVDDVEQIPAQHLEKARNMDVIGEVKDHGCDGDVATRMN